MKMKFEGVSVTESLAPQEARLSWGIQFEENPAEGKEGVVKVPSLTSEDVVFIKSVFGDSGDTRVKVQEHLSILPTERLISTFDEKEAKKNRQREAISAFKSHIKALAQGASFAFLLAVTSSTPEKGVHASGQSTEQVAREKVRAVKNADGSITYMHEDLETTEIIDYLAGRGPVSDRMLAMCMRGEMASMLEFGGESVKGRVNREKIYHIDTRAEIEAFYKEIFPKLGVRYREVFDSAGEFATDRITWRLEEETQWRSKMSPKLYDVLWKMERVSGAPQIRWADEESEKIPGRESFIGTSSYFIAKDASGHSNPTIYLDASLCTEEGIDTLIQEISHAQNFAQSPEQVEERHRKEDALLQPKIDELNRDYDVKLNQYREILYDTPGTEEHYAHSVVYPRLLREVAPFLGKHEENEEIIVTVPRGKTEKR